MKHTLVNILFKFRFLEPKVSYSVLPSMGSLPWFIFLMFFLPSFENFCKPAISLKNLIRYQMRKSLNVLTAESMLHLEIYITWCVSLQSPVLTGLLEEATSRDHLSFLNICGSSVYADGDKYFGSPILT